MTQHCSRCDSDLARPIEENANYVTHTDFAETEKREGFFGMQHTEETHRRVKELHDDDGVEKPYQQLSAEMASPNAPDTVTVTRGTEVIQHEGGETETAVSEEVAFSIPEDEFDHVRVESPDAVVTDPEIAHTYSVLEDREVQKTALVCPPCTKDDDDIIWGVDK